MMDVKSEKYIEELLGELTLEEKIGMIHGATLFNTKGVDRLDIPAFRMDDGPMGVRPEHADDVWVTLGNNDDFVSYLPCNSAIASTWNREVAGNMGFVLGEETRGRGKDMILAPGINIKRSPLCGRNFEYLSEDPKLIEEMVVPLVQGIQKNDVASCVKHFAANSQETNRLYVDTIVDERTLQEIYFPGFKAAIEKGGLFSIMGAYNLLNGEHCCTSKKLLNGVLREQWGFDGLVVSDWGGVHDTDLAAESALDVEMDVTSEFDNHFMANPLLKKIREGGISEEAVDKKVRNILRTMLRLKMIGVNKESRKKGCYNTPEHQKAILDAARESVILLKNEEGILPLNPEKAGKVAVIGANATQLHSYGGGSAEINALYEICPLMGIKKVLGGNTRITYTPGYWVPKKERRPGISWQADSTKRREENVMNLERYKYNTDDNAAMAETYLKEAVKLAKESDTVIFVGGLNHDYDVEGLDREDMKLPYNQDKVIEELLKVNPNTVVVMFAGSPVEMPWLSQTKALLWNYYSGMEGGTALAEVIFGMVNPSGKLAETFIKNADSCPAKTGINFAKDDSIEYTEGVMVGYRYYDTHDTDVNFCFGYGKSYTEFEYGNLEIKDISGESGKDILQVSFDITNTGSEAGMEAAQVYVAPMCTGSVVRPYHELKDFEKIFLNQGETKRIQILLDESDFSCYDTDMKNFVKIPGIYEIQIGASSRDIRLKAQTDIK